MAMAAVGFPFLSFESRVSYPSVSGNSQGKLHISFSNFYQTADFRPDLHSLKFSKVMAAERILTLIHSKCGHKPLPERKQLSLGKTSL